MDRISNTNMSTSLYYPILMYGANKLIQINFSYTRFGTTRKTGTLYLFNNIIYTDYDVSGLHINQIDNDYYLTINQATAYTFDILCESGNAYRDGNYYTNIDFGNNELTDIKEIHENRTTSIETLFNSYYENVAPPIKTFDYTGLTENKTELIYKNTGNQTKIILLKIGERKTSGNRAWGLYLIIINGSTTPSNTTISTILINGDETYKDYAITQDGQNINLVMSPTVSTRYTFEIIA